MLLFLQGNHLMKIRLLLALLPLVLIGEEIAFEPKPLPQATYRELQFENDSVRVWKTTIVPFSPLKMHRHEQPRVIVGLEGGVLKKITEKGEISFLAFETGKAVWMDADPEGELHADVNESEASIVVMVIELKE